MHQHPLTSGARASNRRLRVRTSVAGGLAFIAFAAAAAMPIATASAATDILAVEGETFVPDAGVTTWLSATAAPSGGQALAIDTIGSARKTVSLAAPASRVVMRARGTQCQGSPRASLAVDGSTVGTVDLTSTNFSDFSMTKAAAAGSHTVTVTFSNDRKNRTCDRTVYLDKVTFVQDAPPPPAAPAPPPPAPAPTPTCGFGSFGPDSMPGACWRPYADTSPFNTPIPATAPADPRSAAIVSRILGFGAADHLAVGTADTTSDWSHPTYSSKSTDPVFTLRCKEPWGTCATEGMQIRVPDAARPAGGSDAHLTVVDQASGWEYDMWAVSSKPRGGGVLEFGWGGRTRIDGDGRNAGATAAHFGLGAGIIRAQELAAGQINHALFMVINCSSGSYVYPALGSGRACASTSEAPPMGSRLQLNMSAAQIDALAVPAWKKTILKAMATYGMYFGDTGGGAWGIQAESGSTYTSFGKEDAMVTFARNNGVPTYNGNYVFNIRDGVDWAKYLRLIPPCTTQGTC